MENKVSIFKIIKATIILSITFGIQIIKPMSQSVSQPMSRSVNKIVLETEEDEVAENKNNFSENIANNQNNLFESTENSNKTAEQEKPLFIEKETILKLTKLFLKKQKLLCVLEKNYSEFLTEPLTNKIKGEIEELNNKIFSDKMIFAPEQVEKCQLQEPSIMAQELSQEEIQAEGLKEDDLPKELPKEIQDNQPKELSLKIQKEEHKTSNLSEKVSLQESKNPELEFYEYQNELSPEEAKNLIQEQSLSQCHNNNENNNNENNNNENNSNENNNNENNSNENNNALKNMAPQNSLISKYLKIEAASPKLIKKLSINFTKNGDQFEEKFIKLLSKNKLNPNSIFKRKIRLMNENEIYKHDYILSLAIEKNKIKIFNYLIDNDADVNVTNENGQTPLHFAAQFYENFSKKEEIAYIVETLAQKGADFNLKDNNGNRPIDLLTLKQNSEIYKYFYLETEVSILNDLEEIKKNNLDEKNINIEQEKKIILDAIFYAAYHANKNILKKAIILCKVFNYDISINSKKLSGLTPLHVAINSRKNAKGCPEALSRYDDIIRIIILCGAELRTIRSEDGKNILDLLNFGFKKIEDSKICNFIRAKEMSDVCKEIEAIYSENK